MSAAKQEPAQKTLYNNRGEFDPIILEMEREAQVGLVSKGGAGDLLNLLNPIS